MTIISGTTVTISETFGGVWEYNVDAGTRQNVQVYPVTLDCASVFFTSGLTVTSSEHYFKIGRNNVTVDGQGNRVSCPSAVNYRGLFANYDSSLSTSFQFIGVKNIVISKEFAPALQENCAFLLGENFGYNQNVVIENIISYADIPENCAALAGNMINSIADLNSQCVLFINCRNYGDIAQGSCGLVRALNFGCFVNCHNFGAFVGANSSGIANYYQPIGNSAHTSLPSNALLFRCANHSVLAMENCRGLAFIQQLLTPLTRNISVDHCFNAGDIRAENCAGLVSLDFDTNISSHLVSFNFCYNTGSFADAASDNSCGLLRLSYLPESNAQIAIFNSYNTGALSSDTQSGMVLATDPNTNIALLLANVYSVVEDSYSAFAFTNTAVSDTAVVNSSTTAEWLFEDALATLGKVGVLTGQVNHSANNYNNYNITYDATNYNSILAKYAYIDVSPVNIYGDIPTRLPFKLITFAHNPYSANSFIETKDLVSDNTLVVDANLTYVGLAPHFGTITVVNSNFTNKSDVELHSGAIYTVNQTTGKLVFNNINIPNQTNKTLVMFTNNVFGDEYPESYIIYKISFLVVASQPLAIGLENFSNRAARDINFKFIPIFRDVTRTSATNTSLWRVNKTDEGETTFGLFEKNATENFINFPTASLNSERYSFDVIRSGDTVPGGLFRVDSVQVQLNESFAKFLSLSSIGFNTNRTRIGDTAGATVETYSYTHKKYILEKKKSNLFATQDIPDDELIIDTDNENRVLFSFWIDSIRPVDSDGNETDFIQVKIQHTIEKVVLFNMQIQGSYINQSQNRFNRNILNTSKIPYSAYTVNIYEYNKKMTIFELDDGNGGNNKIGPNQIGELNLARVVNRVHRTGLGENDVFRYRRYDIGTGVLYNVDVSTHEFSPAVQIKKLRIKRGQFVLKKKKPTNAIVYDAFFFEVDARDVELLPNALDPTLYIITESVSSVELGISVYYTNPIKNF
jgi:hypothetical protein